MAGEIEMLPVRRVTHVVGHDANGLAGRTSQAVSRILSAARRARFNNAWDLPELASPPVVSDSNAPTIASPKYYAASSLINFPKNFLMSGGKQLVSNTRTFAHAATGGATGGNINNSGKFQNGYAVELDSAAPAFDFRVWGKPTYWFIVDGQYVNKTPKVAGTTTSETAYIYANFSALPRKKRNIRLVIGSDADGFPNQFDGVHVRQIDAIARPDDGGLASVCFVGDSFGSGAGAVNYSLGWTHLTAMRLGFRQCQVSCLGGTGYIASNGGLWNFEQRVDDIALVPTELLVLAGGYNDAGFTPAAVQAAVLSYLAAARARLPLVPIVVLGAWAGASGPSAAIIATENAISAAVTAFNDPLCKFVPVSVMPNATMSPWINGTGYVGHTNGSGTSDEATSADGAHPSTLGHDAYISARAYEGILTALQSM